MKIFDKLKNALFEEEYVEVEEKEKVSRKEKKEKEKVKKVKPSSVKATDDSDIYDVEKPIAKRIIPLDKFGSKEKDETEKEETDLLKEEEPKIKAFSDNDLVSQNTYPELPPITEVTRKRTDNVNYPEEEEFSELSSSEATTSKEEIIEEKVLPEERPVKLYQAGKKDAYLENYTPHEYGNYEKQKEKETFKPSPIISPVYGIVEDTRFMDKPAKREVRITTSISHEKINIDDIRRKAYGNLSDEIDDNLGIHQSKLPEDNEAEDLNDNMLLDLTNDNATPEVNNLTVGDAVEYFEDLGLEYNEDYIDADKPTRTSKLKESEDNLDAKVEEKNTESDYEISEKTEELDLPKILEDDSSEEVEEDNVIVKDKDSDDVTNSDNLFDLIDSMYEE